MFNRLVDLMSESGWTYFLIYLVSLVDAVFPVVPSETVVIGGGVLAASGHLVLVLVIIAGALGAFTGDNASYWLGHRFGRPVADRLLRGRRSQEGRAWARRMLDRRGTGIIIAARFIPGGRTATTLTAGTTGYPYRRFAPAAAVGGTLWAVYAGLLGSLGGVAFHRDIWKALLFAFGVATTVTVAIEVTRAVAGRHRRRRAQRPPAQRRSASSHSSLRPSNRSRQCSASTALSRQVR